MTWKLPTSDRIFKACGATWVPASAHRDGPWTIREGAGGGSRVSAATLEDPDGVAQIARAEAAMAALRQAPLFCVRGGEAALDAALEAAGYEIAWPVVALVAPVGAVDRPEPMRAIPCSAPLARAREIWAEGGVGPSRLAVMARVDRPKTYLLGRHKDRPAGAAFVAVDQEIAVMHALEVRPAMRRQGVGAALTLRAGEWARGQGASSLALLVTRQNSAARALYETFGFVEAAQYHYRRRVS